VVTTQQIIGINVKEGTWITTHGAVDWSLVIQGMRVLLLIMTRQDPTHDKHVWPQAPHCIPFLSLIAARSKASGSAPWLIRQR